MRINELRAREDFDRILQATLQFSLTDFCQQDIGRVVSSPPGQAWRVHNLLSVYCTNDLCPAGRRFLADQLRFTPVTWRAPAQWVMGTALASRAGLRVVGAPGFWLTRPVSDPGRYLILPGNRRVRFFDFQRGVTRTVAKAEFDSDSIEREVMVRAQGMAGPFPSILRSDPAGRWFDEPILVGYALPRCPPWRGRRRWELRAKIRLRRWLDATASTMAFDDYLSDLLRRIEDQSKHSSPLVSHRAISVLSERASRELSGVELRIALTHGDFQPGNIFVDVLAHESILLDWEFAATRQWAFDGFVYELRSRFPAQLSERIHRYIQGESSGSPLLPSTRCATSRGALVALFLLEELEWHLHTMTSTDYARVPPGTQVFCEQLAIVLAGRSLR